MIGFASRVYVHTLIEIRIGVEIRVDICSVGGFRGWQWRRGMCRVVHIGRLGLSSLGPSVGTGISDRVTQLR